ncbi:hypothetical protein RFI_08493 [Reticulomyxa filosa]|uniref:Uncharacterized protein n=1 Tax=Reticulomyxa filosa TaxID=46433 RepID=X6NRI2_RETFI|nr:hypothetical protein RFI_08493 [Reticulomyxa filosa]|eukprot:ETO28636.1 hypothetical protein RFI_08493 [Reticulomyxa filosa]
MYIYNIYVFIYLFVCLFVWKKTQLAPEALQYNEDMIAMSGKPAYGQMMHHPMAGNGGAPLFLMQPHAGLEPNHSMHNTVIAMPAPAMKTRLASASAARMPVASAMPSSAQMDKQHNNNNNNNNNQESKKSKAKDIESREDASGDHSKWKKEDSVRVPPNLPLIFVKHKDQDGDAKGKDKDKGEQAGDGVNVVTPPSSPSVKYSTSPSHHSSATSTEERDPVDDPGSAKPKINPDGAEKLDNYRVKEKIEHKLKRLINTQRDQIEKMQKQIEEKGAQIRVQLIVDQKIINDAFAKTSQELQEQIDIQQQLLRIALHEHHKWKQDCQLWKNALETDYWQCKVDAERNDLLEKSKQFYRDCSQRCRSKYAVPLKHIDLKFPFIYVYPKKYVYVYFFIIIVHACLCNRYEQTPFTQDMIGPISGKVALKPQVVVRIVKKFEDCDNSESDNEKESKQSIEECAKNNNHSKDAGRNKGKKVNLLRVEISSPSQQSSIIRGFVVQIIQRDFAPKVIELSHDKEFVEIKLSNELNRWCGDVWVQSQSECGLGEAVHVTVDLKV